MTRLVAIGLTVLGEEDVLEEIDRAVTRLRVAHPDWHVSVKSGAGARNIHVYLHAEGLEEASQTARRDIEPLLPDRELKVAWDAPREVGEGGRS